LIIGPLDRVTQQAGSEWCERGVTRIDGAGGSFAPRRTVLGEGIAIDHSRDHRRLT